jgi:hypothetical protein
VEGTEWQAEFAYFAGPAGEPDVNLIEW